MIKQTPLTLGLGLAPVMSTHAARETPAKGEGQQHSLTWQRKPPLVSRWADGLRLKTPLPEYPRPQMVRDEWMNLNGEWDFLGDGPEPPVLPTKRTGRLLCKSNFHGIAGDYLFGSSPDGFDGN